MIIICYGCATLCLWGVASQVKSEIIHYVHHHSLSNVLESGSLDQKDGWRGPVVAPSNELTSTHGDAGSIPGLAQ